MFQFARIIKGDRCGFTEVVTRILKGAYFNPSLGEIACHYDERQSIRPEEKLIKTFIGREILQPANPEIGHRRVQGHRTLL